MEEEEVMAASPDAVSPGGGAEGYEKTKAIYIAFTVQAAMNKLYSDDPCRHVIIRVDEKKKSRGRKKYYAELASAGEENLAAVHSTPSVLVSHNSHSFQTVSKVIHSFQYILL